MAIAAQVKMYANFALGLRKFLREPLTPEQSRSIIRRRLENRDKNLLLLAKNSIYENGSSPYRALLKMIGCEYGDFKQMVQADGIEETLKRIAGQGVYISLEEFKGKAEIIRGSTSFKFAEHDFDNPFLSGQLGASSGATRSAGTRTNFDFRYLTEDLAVYLNAGFEAYDASNIPVALWYPIMPGAGPLFVLGSAKAGKVPIQWFTPVKRRDFKPSLKNRMGTNYLVYACRLFGAGVPIPQHVALDDAWIVAEWLADVIRKHGGCFLGTYVSAAMRICQAAKQRGLDIAGTKFFTTGEPVTEAKRKEIEASKAIIYPYYAFIEVGAVGYGCVNPAAADEVHFFKDKLVLVQRHTEVPHASVSINAFLFTTLMPSAPKILLNVQSGDYGVIESRSCGCRFEELGFTDHIYNIRGFDKLTGEGMTFISMDLVRIIDEILPARFGGSSIDYQILEEEDEHGQTRLKVIASPELGTIDEAMLARTVLEEISKGKDGHRMMADVWAQAKTLQVKRTHPYATARGKLMPLHVQKRR